MSAAVVVGTVVVVVPAVVCDVPDHSTFSYQGLDVPTILTH